MEKIKTLVAAYSPFIGQRMNGPNTEVLNALEKDMGRLVHPLLNVIRDLISTYPKPTNVEEKKVYDKAFLLLNEYTGETGIMRDTSPKQPVVDWQSIAKDLYEQLDSAVSGVGIVRALERYRKAIKP